MTNVTLHRNIIKLWHWKNNNDHVLTHVVTRVLSHVVTHGQPYGETGDSAPGLTAAPWCSKSKTSCCRPWGKGLGLICGKEWWLTDSMVGGWATPLKNMNESQLGWLFIPNINGKIKKMATKPPTSIVWLTERIVAQKTKKTMMVDHLNDRTMIDDA